MVHACSAFGCSNRFSKEKNISFYSFPRDPVRRKLWILAMRRKNYEPSKTARICSEHFQTGRPSHDRNHPDYVPNVFSFAPLKKTRKNDLKLKKATTCIPPSSSETNTDINFQTCDAIGDNGGPSKDSNHPEYVPSIFSFDPPNKTSTNNLKLKEAALYILSNNPETNADVNFESYHTIENNGSKDAEELLSLKLELNGAFTDINILRKENDTLVKQLSTAEETQNLLRKAISGKEEELIKVKKELLTVSEKEKELVQVKKELQQAYTEISALRMEKEKLQKQLISSDITQGILQDPYKLNFYTGLNRWKDFNFILSLLSKVENRIRCVSLETQLLIVLTKLKLNLLNVDLAYRFQTSHKTVRRIFNQIIPPLQTKIDLLVKSPVNTALRKNLSVCFKNTVYDNLHQRLTKYSKLQMKHLDNEEEESDSDIL